MKGTVKWFSIKGYGFIAPQGGGEDCFVHYSGITGEGYRILYAGDIVEYDQRDDGRGPKAVNVRLKAATLNGF